MRTVLGSSALCAWHVCCHRIKFRVEAVHTDPGGTVHHNVSDSYIVPQAAFGAYESLSLIIPGTMEVRRDGANVQDVAGWPPRPGSVYRCQEREPLVVRCWAGTAARTRPSCSSTLSALRADRVSGVTAVQSKQFALARALRQRAVLRTDWPWPTNGHMLVCDSRVARWVRLRT